MQYRFSDLELDTIAGVVRRDGVALELSGLTLQFLTALVEASPEPLDADQLAERVWRRSHVTDETVKKRASLVRAAIGAELIRTLPDRRYALAVTVERAQAEGKEPAASRSDAPQEGADMAGLIRRAMIGGAIMFVALAAVTIWAQRAPEAPRLVNPETGDVLEAPRS